VTGGHRSIIYSIDPSIKPSNGDEKIVNRLLVRSNRCFYGHRCPPMSSKQKAVAIVTVVNYSNYNVGKKKWRIYFRLPTNANWFKVSNENLAGQIEISSLMMGSIPAKQSHQRKTPIHRSSRKNSCFGKQS
jgi:hypothetical protein